MVETGPVTATEMPMPALLMAVEKEVSSTEETMEAAVWVELV